MLPKFSIQSRVTHFLKQVCHFSLLNQKLFLRLVETDKLILKVYENAKDLRSHSDLEEEEHG